jgi:hypothetical protein
VLCLFICPKCMHCTQLYSMYRRYTEVGQSSISQSITALRIRIRLRILPFSSLTFKMATKKIFPQVFLLVTFEATFTSFFKNKKLQRSHKQWESRFSYYFCFMIEGSGSVPLINGSGSGRPKNILVRLLRIRIWYYGALVFPMYLD